MILPAKDISPTNKHLMQVDEEKQLKRNHPAAYYSISPNSLPYAHPQSENMGLSDSENKDSEKLEYFSILSQKDKFCYSTSANTDCDMDVDSNDEPAFILSRSISAVTDEGQDPICLTPDEDFMRDGYCRCSFCSHDDLPFSNMSVKTKEHHNKSIIFTNNTNDVKSSVNNASLKKLISWADVAECNSPWMKERKPRELSRQYLESYFHRSTIKLFHQCEIESLQEAEVNTK